MLPLTYNQMIHMFEHRLIEILQKLETGKDSRPTYMPDWNKKQRQGLVSLYNLNLRLLKLWKPKELRNEIS